MRPPPSANQADTHLPSTTLFPAEQSMLVPPVRVTHITDRQGNLSARFTPPAKRVLSAGAGWLMLYMLRGGMEEPGGTSQALWAYDLWQKGNQIGGKTGTTSNYSDGWSIGVDRKSTRLNSSH